jgi:hypothetical protein
MPRFPVAFGKRRSTADSFGNGPAVSSFRVLDRSEVAGKNFDGGARLGPRAYNSPNLNAEDIAEDNIFASLKPNRYVSKPSSLTP